MPPYSENIIFLDTEFTYLDARKSELLSIGLVKYSGEELYLEFEPPSEMDPWVVEKVIPHLRGEYTSKEDAKTQIEAFFGDSKPYVVAYVNQFDSVLWYDLFGSAQDHPAFWIPIDFASMLFAHGFSPNSMGKHAFYSELGVEMADYEGRPHNALDDAKFLREVYIKFFESKI